MTKARIGILALVAGLALGSGATTLLRLPSRALAQSAGSAMQMSGMQAKPASSGDTQMNAAMSRMMREMANSKLTGNQDRDFMVMMIPHHESAVAMAKIELARGTRSPLKALARDIIQSQDKEISQMRGWLAAWYAKPSR